MISNLKYNLGVAYDFEVKKRFGSKPDLHSYFKHHPRRDLLIGNIHDKIKEHEFSSKPFKPDQIVMIAHEFINQFFKVAITYAEQQALSDLERSLIREQTPEELEKELVDGGYIKRVEDERD